MALGDGDPAGEMTMGKRVGCQLGRVIDRMIPAPDYWLLPPGHSVYEESKLVEQ
jgi:hypothetical protein